MTSLERRLHDALLTGANTIDPAPDLFTRVRRGIDDDRRRRRQRRRGAAVGAALLGSLAAVVAATSDVRGGRLLMDWWVLELITTAILVGLALWLGPFIKRFGRSYAADVFQDNPRTGKSYVVLTDIVYYLIFTAFILFTVHFEPPVEWSTVVDADQLKFEVSRVGGILLIIGVLHGLNILIMPLLGRLFSLNRQLHRRLDAGSGDRDE